MDHMHCIPISAPSKLHVLQALVDHKYCFMLVYVEWPGSVHDACVFANSELYRPGRNITLFPRSTLQLDGSDVPIVILADTVYPLMTWSLKTVANGTANREQQRFNYRLSQARMVIENRDSEGRWRSTSCCSMLYSAQSSRFKGKSLVISGWIKMKILICSIHLINMQWIMMMALTYENFLLTIQTFIDCSVIRLIVAAAINFVNH